MTATTTGEAYGLRRRGTDRDLERWDAGTWTTIATLPAGPPAFMAVAVHESSGVVVVAAGTGLMRWGDGAWQLDGAFSSDSVARLAYDADDDVVVAVDSVGTTRVWSPSTGWTTAATAGGLGLGVGGDGSVITVGSDGTYQWTSAGWNRTGGRYGEGAVVMHGAGGQTLLVNELQGDVLELRAGRWAPTAQRTDVLDRAYSPDSGLVSVDRDSGRIATIRTRNVTVDRAWVGSVPAAVFDGEAWLPGVVSSAYAGPGRGLLVLGGGSAWQWNTAGVDFVALPADVDGFTLVGYDRASASVLGLDNRGRTFGWDGATWSPGIGTLTGRSPAATDPATGALHILESGVLQRWASGWVTVDDHPEASGIGAHDARGTLVLFGSRDGVVTVHEGPPWVERDVRGELPMTIPSNGAYHAPTDSVVTRRHMLRLLSGVGLPCADADDCGGGFCVDGVCCDDPCGGGALDCMACSVAEGAAMDGHCGPLAGGVAESVECRASTDPCDVAERCSSGSPVCPGDGIVVDGTSCDDGLVCNGVEVCVAGACTPGASACDDGDPCTSDACAEPDGCLHVPVAACCSMDVECDDGDACTADRCVDHACAHEASCPDAGTDAGSADAGTMRGGLSGGGCGCRAVAFREGPGAIVWAALALGLCARRRLS